MTEHDKYYHRETQMQKLRLATPIGMIANFFTAIGGFTVTGMLIWHWVGGVEQSIKYVNRS